MENSILRVLGGSHFVSPGTTSCSLLMDKTWVMPRNYPQQGGQQTDPRQRLLILFKLGWFGDSNSSREKTHKSILPLNAKKSLAARRTLGLLSTVRTLLWTIKRPQQSGGFQHHSLPQQQKKCCLQKSDQVMTHFVEEMSGRWTPQSNPSKAKWHCFQCTLSASSLKWFHLARRCLRLFILQPISTPSAHPNLVIFVKRSEFGADVSNMQSMDGWRSTCARIRVHCTYGHVDVYVIACILYAVYISHI